MALKVKAVEKKVKEKGILKQNFCTFAAAYNDFVKQYLIRIGLVAFLLCATLLDSADGIRAQVAAKDGQRSEELIGQHDGWLQRIVEERRYMLADALRPSSSSSRLASSRPARVLPTHGGKPTHHSGRWYHEDSSNHLLYTALQPCTSRYRLCATVASPRLCYVIALRRLLC